MSISDRSLKLTESSLEAQAALEEYRTLRQEILNLQQQAYQITGLAFSIGSGVAALAAFAGKSEPAICGFVFLAMAIMYWPLIHSQVRRRNGIYWLGRYIEHVIEERIPGLHWESAWCRQTFKMNRELQGERSSCPKNSKTRSNGKEFKIRSESSSLIENSPLVLLQILCSLGGFYFYSQTSRPMLPIVIWAVVISAAFVYEFREIYGANDMGEYHTELCSYRDELFPPDLAVVTKQLETPKRGDDEQKKLQGRGT